MHCDVWHTNKALIDYKMDELTSHFSLAGYREGLLWKRGRDNGQFLSRKFVLSEREGALKYFNKNDVSKNIMYTKSIL